MGKRKSSNKWGSSGDSDTSSSGSSTSSSSSSSVEASSSSNNKSSSSYDKIFEDTKDTAATPPFICVKGVPHFRSKMTGDLVNAGKPSNTPCRSCQNCHGYWQGAVYACKGAGLRKKV